MGTHRSNRDVAVEYLTHDDNIAEHGAVRAAAQNVFLRYETMEVRMETDTVETADVAALNALALTTFSRTARASPGYAASAFGASREFCALLSRQDERVIESAARGTRHSLVAMRRDDHLWQRLLQDDMRPEVEAALADGLIERIRRLNLLCMLVMREHARRNTVLAAAEFFGRPADLERLARMRHDEILDHVERHPAPVITLAGWSCDLWRRLSRSGSGYPAEIVADHLRIKGLMASRAMRPSTPRTP